MADNRYQYYITDVDVACDPEDAVATVREVVGNATHTRVTLIDPSGPGGGCPVVRVVAAGAPTKRLLLEWYGEDVVTHWVSQQTQPHLPARMIGKG
jgi:hypothetical protein